MRKHSTLEIVSLCFLCQSLLGPKQYFPAVAFVLADNGGAWSGFRVEPRRLPKDNRGPWKTRRAMTGGPMAWLLNGQPCGAAVPLSCLKGSTAAPQRRSSPVRPDADAQLLEEEEEAATCCRILSFASVATAGQVKQNLQGCCVPTATALSHHWHKLHPLRLASCRGAEVELLVSSIGLCSRACLLAGQRKRLLPLWRRDVEVEGSRSPCESRQVHFIY